MPQTKVFSIKNDTDFNSDVFETAAAETAKALLDGKIAAFPTETVYGLGASIFNEEAVLKIYEAKGRPPEKPLSILIQSIADAESIASEIPAQAELLANHFWPGPLTIILNKSENISNQITAGKNTVGLRVPAHPIALELVKRVGPLACPSANLSGNRNPLSASDVLEDLDSKIHILIDGGRTEVQVPSTIIDLTVQPPKILRKGGLDIEEIKKHIGEISE